MDEIELKLREMRNLAEYAKENVLESQEREEINIKFNKLQHQVNTLAEKSENNCLKYI